MRSTWSRDYLPDVPASGYAAALMEGQRYLFSLGVTAWQDAIVGAYPGMADTGSTYGDAVASGDLVADVVGALWWDRELGLGQVSDLMERRRTQTSSRYRATSIKIMQDGVCENFTAAMLSPYLDGHGHATGNAGLVRRARGAEGGRRRARRRGLPGARALARRPRHAGGARRLRGGARGRAADDLRHHIAHIQVIHPDDVPRFAELGVAANAQALWAAHEPQMDELTIPFLGDERSTWQYPFGGLHRGRRTLVAGSDWPVTSPDPLAAIHAAVNPHGVRRPAGAVPTRTRRST